MKEQISYRVINYLVAAVWFINGLFCKVLNFVPRHGAIVAKILDTGYAPLLTKMIGFAEIGMAIWILSGILRRLNVITQILVVAAMNTLEFLLAPDLLLWGKWNALFALLFIVMLYCNEFYWNKTYTHSA